jgi:hypothetical protein
MKEPYGGEWTAWVGLDHRLGYYPTAEAAREAVDEWLRKGGSAE